MVKRSKFINLNKVVTCFLSASLLISPVSVCAAEKGDSVDASQINGQIGDGQVAADYLLQHRQEEIVDRSITSESSKSFPEKLDLREKGVVTPVKSQTPWGSCWGFAAIAAAETSILSESGKTYEETGLDLSEHHLGYFASRHITDETDSQYGEGTYIRGDYEALNIGGEFTLATSIMSSGIGPVTEEFIPYRGTKGKTMGVLWRNASYSTDDDWTIPDDYMFMQNYQLLDGNMLKSPAVYDQDYSDFIVVDKSEFQEHYLGYDQSAVDAIKEELMNGRAVCIGYHADHSKPFEEAADNDINYISVDDEGRWLQYVYDCALPNHAVTIIGWDDTIKRESFADHSNDANGDGQAHLPDGDGAFLCKNSWGSATRGFPNNPFSKWGNVDENGFNTGYFYLSYYDTSITVPESLRFNPDANATSFIIDEYDYMHFKNVENWLSDTGLQMANRFTADYDEVLKCVSCQTGNDNTKVKVEVYLLNDGAVCPDDGELATAQEMIYEHAGYHRMTLDTPVEVKASHDYAIVVTESVEHEGKQYYSLNTGKDINEEGVNQKEKVIEAYLKENNIEGDITDYIDRCYSKSVVNAGESYVYIDELGQWFDFSDLVQTMSENSSDKFSHDYDNFSIKGYAEFADPEEAAMIQAEGGKNIAPLKYSKPKGNYNYRFIVIAVCVVVLLLTGIIALIVLTIKKIRKSKKSKHEK